MSVYRPTGPASLPDNCTLADIDAASTDHPLRPGIDDCPEYACPLCWQDEREAPRTARSRYCADCEDYILDCGYEDALDEANRTRADFHRLEKQLKQFIAEMPQ